MADFNLHLALDQHTELQIKNITAEANQLNVQSDKKSVAQLASLALTDSSVALAQQKISLGALQLTGLKTSVIRQADQQLNWLALLAPAATKNTAEAQIQPVSTSTSPTASAKKSAWAFGLKRFATRRYSY